MPDWTTVLSKLFEVTGEDLRPFSIRPVAGGCINGAIRLEARGHRYFVKHNDPSRLPMFEAEAEGLRALGTAGTLRVPTPVCWGADRTMSFLVVEWLELSSPDARTQVALGKQLAALHRISQSRYGWHRDNTIGATPQKNAQSDSWADFFRERRLGFQFALAGRRGFGRLETDGERLLARLDRFFAGYVPQASLLHGDLWSGNVGKTSDGVPAIFDPAVYYGDRETDVAMTELFGGFSNSFYRSYNEAWPLAPGYESRKTLYNLYHVLNHLNLFGRGYLSQAQGMVNKLLAEIG